MLLNKKSQSIFEFAVAIIAISGLVIGIVRIWIWFNANYAKRQYSYQQTRLSAVGKTRPLTYNDPVATGYTPLELTKDWVFKGRPSGTVSGAPLDELGGVSSDELCDLQCKEKCSSDPGCGSEDVFNINCDCYKECQGQCLCDNHIKSTIQVYDNQITSLLNNAQSMHNSADSMRQAADRCDDPWEICWWGNWGKSAKELRRGARELDRSARGLERAAARLKDRRDELSKCCDEQILIQTICLDNARVRADCGGDCAEKSEEYINTCESKCSGWMVDFCYSTCEAQGKSMYNTCFKTCVLENAPSCAESVASVIASIQDQIDSYNQTIKEDQALYDEISGHVTKCNADAKTKCTTDCTSICTVLDESGNPVFDPSCFDTCYAGCYDTQRNSCCQSGCCQGATGGWSRGCDMPSDDCDEACTSSPEFQACIACKEGQLEDEEQGKPVRNCDAICAGHDTCPKCGLTKAASNINTEIQELQAEITRLTGIKNSLPACCNLSKTEDQNNCIAQKISE